MILFLPSSVITSHAVTSRRKAASKQTYFLFTRPSYDVMHNVTELEQGWGCGSRALDRRRVGLNGAGGKRVWSVGTGT